MAETNTTNLYADLNPAIRDELFRILARTTEYCEGGDGRLEEAQSLVICLIEYLRRQEDECLTFDRVVYSTLCVILNHLCEETPAYRRCQTLLEESDLFKFGVLPHVAAEEA